MVKLTTEKLEKICATIAGGILSQAAAAQACDVSISSFWGWVAQSQRHPDDTRFNIEFCGEPMRFHEGVKAARKVALHDVLGRFEQRMLVGHDEKIFFGGVPSWVEDESLASFSDEEVRELLSLPDRYLRDANGRRIQHVIHHEPPIAGVIKVLESNFHLYRQRSEVNQNTNISGGVTVVPQKPIAKALPTVRAIEPPKPEVADENGLREILGPEKGEPAPPIEMASGPQAEPVPEPQPIQAEPPKPLSELQRDLLQRLQTLRENGGPVNPKPEAGAV